VVGLKKSKEVISARLPKERIRLIEKIAQEEKVDKSTILYRALEHYTKEWTLQKAVELYRDGTITLSRAAEIAGISIWEMIDVLGKRKIILQYDVEDLEEDLKTLGCG
jgi:predicted HTH domain antitoxin